MSSAEAVVGEKRRLPKTVERLLKHRLFRTGAILFSCIALLSISAGWIAGVSPNEIRFKMRFMPPGPEAWLGTDNFGRDILSRLLHGGQYSLAISLGVVLLTGVCGTIIGLCAGYFRRADEFIMRVMDALMAFPSILLAIAIAASLGPSATNAILAISIVYTPRTARVVRGAVLVVREQEYVQAAITSGVGNVGIILRHILPNSMTPLIVQLSFIFAYSILTEAILSFLGVGPPPPIATWGNMIAEGRSYIRDAVWIVASPGVAILLTALSVNFLGDAMRDAFDPKMIIRRGN